MKHPAEEIRTIISKFKKIEAIREIWEIGSRDGQDALALAHSFPHAGVKSFEPNPDTFKMVEAVSINSSGKIKALNLALSDQDGEITFNKIDTSKTITTWPDGNPGASSIFIASEQYDIEKYFQIPIKVKSHSAKTLIEGHGLTTPDLIWMDVQGAEGLVIKGFGDHIYNVDFIYVELSLKALYSGQPLAAEIVKQLSKDFYWHSNLNKGSWQFDALFVNKKYGNCLLRIKSALLILSLKTNIKIGIEHSMFTFLRKPISFLKRSLIRMMNSQLRKSDSGVLGSLVMNFSLKTARVIRSQKLPFRLRQAISLAQPSDPLKDSILPTIDIAIPCHKKDFGNLHLVIQGARKNVKNPIGKVVLITPDNLAMELESKFPDCQVLSDESVLGGGDLTKAIYDLVPLERRGWIIQQIIKFQITMTSNEVATLILDADTILTKPRIWINRGETQILCIAEEFHLPYKEHQRKVFGGQNNLLSFVTHHQLMKKEAVKEIFGSNGDGLLNWLQLADYSESSAISEYDTYGEWLVAHRPHEIAFAKWNNCPVKITPQRNSYNEIADRYGQYHSISNHSYL